MQMAIDEASNVTDSPALRYVYRHPGLGSSISGQVRATATETEEFAVAYMQGIDTVKMLTLVINPADDVGGIGYVAAGGNGLTVQRVGPTVGGIVTCERQAGRLVQRTKVPPAVRFKSTIDLLVFNTFYGFLPSVTLLNNLHVFCNL